MRLERGYIFSFNSCNWWFKPVYGPESVSFLILIRWGSGRWW